MWPLQMAADPSVVSHPRGPRNREKRRRIPMPSLPRLSRLLKCCALLSLTVCAARVIAQDKPYTVTNGRVDTGTFQGWQVYQDANCGLCHGDSAQGPAEPDLRRRLKSISKERFVESVIKGRGL